MTMGRSSAYWSANRYPDPEAEPEPTAPLRDLPAAAGARFRAVRSGLLAIKGVAESVRYMGANWRWSWEYGIGSRKLCWLHVVGDGISATFTLSDMEESRVRAIARLPADLARAIAESQRTGPVRWCWLELADRRSVDGFLTFARRKGEWLSERPAPHRGPRARGAPKRRGGDLEAE
ncbi:MAG: hypothetical protein ACREM9_10495 [Gemmatimonadales bacterium]